MEKFLRNLLAADRASRVFARNSSRHHIIAEPGRHIAPPAANFDSRHTLLRLFATVLLLTPITVGFFYYPLLTKLVCAFAVLFAAFYLTRLSRAQSEANARAKLLGFAILCCFAVGFWTLYHLEPSLLSVYIEEKVRNTLFGITLSSDGFFSFECLFIVLIGFLLSRLWTTLAARGRHISLVIKFAFALFFIAAGYFILSTCISLNGYSHSLPAVYVVIAYAFFALAFLVVRRRLQNPQADPAREH